jgi:hypothetical protein
MLGNEINYLNKDSGSGYWGNFKHYFDVRSNGYYAYKEMYLVPWSLSDSSGATYAALSSAQKGIALVFYEWNNHFILKNFATGETDQDVGAFEWDTWRYFTVERTDDSITCKIYSSSARDAGTLLDTLTIPYTDDTFRFVTVNASDGRGSTEAYATCAVANVDIGQSSGPIEPPTYGPTKIFGGCSMGGGSF